MQKSDKWIWCLGITLTVFFVLPIVLLGASQHPAVEEYVASRVFSRWVIRGHPEKSILVWDNINSYFPFRFEVIGSRWRNPQCLQEGRDDCDMVVAPEIQVSMDPLSFLWSGKMDIKYLNVPHMAIASNTSQSHTPHVGGRRLLSNQGEWPSFSHHAEFHTFRIERLSIVDPAAMATTIHQLVTKPNARARINYGDHDVMLFGSMAIAPNGGDWRITTTAYTIDDDGEFTGGHHLKTHIQGFGETQRVEGRADITFAETTKAHLEGFSDWKALFGISGEGRLDFDVTNEFGDAYGTLGLDPKAWCNMTIKDVRVEGHLGDLHNHELWPEDIRVLHPQGEAHCFTDSCVLSSHGFEVVVRPLETGVLAEHSLANVTVNTCGGSTDISTWSQAVRADRSDVCGLLHTVVGDGGFEVAQGELVTAFLSGSRSEVTHGKWSADHVDIHANLTSLDVVVEGAHYGKHEGPDRVSLQITPQANWTLDTSDGDWMTGWVSLEKGKISDGSIRGYQVLGEARKDSFWFQGVNNTSWVKSRGEMDWEGKTWWDRFARYHLGAHLDKGLHMFGIDVSGVVELDLGGGGRTLPKANLTLTNGHMARPETHQQISDANGYVQFPSGDYALQGIYHSDTNNAEFTSEGSIVVSPASLEGESYTRYHAEDGKWDRIDTWFEWEWGS